MQTVYIYVDESGQDTEGELFIVSVVVALKDHDELSQQLGQIEQATHKRRKWHKTSDPINLAFIRRAGELSSQVIAYAEVQRNITDYFTATAGTISRALNQYGMVDKRVFVRFDGLPRTKEQILGSILRKQGVPVYKVRGVDDEKEPLIRLADAICGLVREATLGAPNMQKALAECIKGGFVIELGQ